MLYSSSEHWMANGRQALAYPSLNFPWTWLHRGRLWGSRKQSVRRLAGNGKRERESDGRESKRESELEKLLNNV